jgi:hypothetical protein
VDVAGNGTVFSNDFFVFADNDVFTDFCDGSGDFVFGCFSKSVSQLISSMMPVFPSAETLAVIFPSLATRLAFLAATAIPRSRRSLMALSMSPSAS